MSTVLVIGAGYVGLTTSACLAHLGHDVTCVDIDEEKVSKLRQGHIPIHESGLPELVKTGISNERLQFEEGSTNAARESEFVFFCLPTPQAADGKVDIDAILSVVNEIREVLAPGSVIINKSTVPVGTNATIAAATRRDDLFVVSNPEFLSEGSAINDFLQPDRIIIGSDDLTAGRRVASLYASIDTQIIQVDPASAETIKYATNSFLATKVSFVNALAAVCEAVGADIDAVTAGLGSDSRISAQFLLPGPGWGGSCFPKDMEALIRIAADAGYEFDLLRAVISANEQQFERIVTKAGSLLGGELGGASVALLGLTFKAHTDDLRNSPAIEVAQRLTLNGAAVRAYDPMITSAVGIPKEIQISTTIEEALTGADLAIILTEWPEFALANWSKLANLMNAPRLVDARNLLERDAMFELGFRYDDLGRT